MYNALYIYCLISECIDIIERRCFMKKHLLIFLAALSLIVSSLYANAPETITLNNMPYQPIHKVLLIDDMTYISLDDFNALTYSSATLNDNALLLHLNGQSIKGSLNSRFIKVGNLQLTLSAPILRIDESIYLPTDFFTLVNYPVTAANDSLSFVSPTPYSSSTDRYIDHKLIPAGDIELKDLVKEASASSAEGEALINDAIKNNHYLVVPFKSSSTALLNALKENLKVSKPMEIVVRQVDFLSKTPSQSSLQTIPITPTLDDGKLTIALDGNTLTSTFFEIAFNPSDANNVIDSNKTFDAILMRLIYSYYRDYYHLKDDVHFSPVGTIEMKRSDTMHFTVYLDQVLDHSPSTYDMIISKQIHEDRISYVVDFIKLA